MAYDHAGKGTADESSLRSAVLEAISMIEHRRRYAEDTAKPLEKSKIDSE